MLPDEYQLITVPEARVAEFREVDEFGFAEHMDEDVLRHLTFSIPFDRTRGVVEVEAGSRGTGASGESLDEAVHAALLRYSWRHRREVLEHLQQNLGRERYAVAGPDAVLDALRRAQADTVVLSDDPSSTLPAWIGPESLQVGQSRDDLAAMGVREPQPARFDAAVLRAIVGSGADLLVTPNAHDYVDGGIAALLRYDDAGAAP